jgi:hypothetical protein
LALAVFKRKKAHAGNQILVGSKLGVDERVNS